MRCCEGGEKMIEGRLDRRMRAAPRKSDSGARIEAPFNAACALRALTSEVTDESERMKRCGEARKWLVGGLDTWQEIRH